MTGPEHYEIAERLIMHLNEIPDPHGDGAHACELVITEAQVHATLALAAATALGREGADGTMPSRDRAEWFSAAATPAPKLSEQVQS